MRGTTTTHRARTRGSTGVALFPFLAVLVSTMGALILVLVVLSRQARLQAARAADEKTVELTAGVADAREMARYRLSALNESREKTEEQLADARLRLGHIEDHARRLEAQLARLQSEWKELDGPSAQDGRQRQDLAAERARLEKEIDEARRQLAGARRASAGQGKSYAIIPYEGPNQTHRRPIYLECRADSVVLQPEGIAFSPADFDGPPGPNNPLASALRAAREHLAGARAAGPGRDDEPYPLLLVRPDGIGAYYAARDAMQSWGSAFGYELVGEDWKLKYHPPDLRLAATVERAVTTARAEQQQLALLTGGPSSGGARERPKVTYRAAPGGGLIREGAVEERGRLGGAFDRDDPPQGERSRRTGTRPGGAFGGSGGGSSNVADRNSFGSGDRQRAPGGRLETAQESAPKRQPRLEGVIPGRPPDEPRELSRGGGEPIVQRPGEWIPLEPRREQRDGSKEEKPGKSLAATRGKNWGLPDATPAAAPVARPIRLECQADCLIVYNDTGDAPEQLIRLGPRSEDSMDQLVSAVWEHMKRWGIAGRGMYWRPLLNVQVAPGADVRYEELRTLLDESGLDVQRRG